MSINIWMAKEAVHNGILLSHKKEHIWVSSNEVTETRAYYAEWSNSKKEKDNGTDEFICKVAMEKQT